MSFSFSKLSRLQGDIMTIFIVSAFFKAKLNNRRNRTAIFTYRQQGVEMIDRTYKGFGRNF